MCLHVCDKSHTVKHHFYHTTGSHTNTHKLASQHDLLVNEMFHEQIKYTLLQGLANILRYYFANEDTCVHASKCIC